jgi:hypothetical protein
MDRKALLRAYKDAPPAAGIYAVRNTVDGMALVGAAPNLPGRLNRERFSLDTGAHLSAPLQADWDRLGAEAFTFETLDTLEPSDDPTADISEELEELLGMWLEKLALPAAKLYPHRQR